MGERSTGDSTRGCDAHSRRRCITPDWGFRRKPKASTRTRAPRIAYSPPRSAHLPFSALRSRAHTRAPRARFFSRSIAPRQQEAYPSVGKKSSPRHLSLSRSSGGGKDRSSGIDAAFFPNPLGEWNAWEMGSILLNRTKGPLGAWLRNGPRRPHVRAHDLSSHTTQHTIFSSSSLLASANRSIDSSVPSPNSQLHTARSS